MSKENEISLLIVLLEELNRRFPVNLSKDIACDRFMDN
jgi:hypothetical protein